MKIEIDRDEATFLLYLLDREKTALEYREHLDSEARAEYEHKSPARIGIDYTEEITRKIYAARENS